MELIVGIGNPGDKYKNTRHNAGFLVADALSEQISSFKHQITNKSQIQIFKSKNFMNESGDFVLSLTKRYTLNPNHLYIIHDDLDLPLGSYKIQFGKGPRDHNGILDIEDKLGTKDFWRVRVGIDNRNLESGILNHGKDYVLEDFTEEERITIDLTIKKLLIDLIALISNDKKV